MFNSFINNDFKAISLTISEISRGNLTNTNTYIQTLETIKKYTKLSAIYITGAGGFEGVAKAIEESGSKGKIKFAAMT